MTRRRRVQLSWNYSHNLSGSRVVIFINPAIVYLAACSQDIATTDLPRGRWQYTGAVVSSLRWRFILAEFQHRKPICWKRRRRRALVRLPLSWRTINTNMNKCNSLALRSSALPSLRRFWRFVILCLRFLDFPSRRRRCISRRREEIRKGAGKMVHALALSACR